MVKPMSPAEVSAAQADGQYIPDEVFTVVNELLIQRGSNAVIKQHEVVGRVIALMLDKIVVEDDLVVRDLRNKIHDEHWLDFEPAYRKAGWAVRFDRPGYNESYDAHWTFSKNTGNGEGAGYVTL